MSASRKVALFGGTFDPIHHGHLEIAQKAVETLGLDHVLFVPCRRSPHKAEAPGASDGDRLKMIQLAAASYPWAIVDDYELKKPPPSFTWETVRHFEAQFNFDARLFLLIGFDQWESLSSWKNIETLARSVEFIVVGRGKQPREREGYTAHIIQGDHPASASQIRSDIKVGKSPSWLPNVVERYISKNALYSPTP